MAAGEIWCISGKIWPHIRRILGCRQFENRHIL